MARINNKRNYFILAGVFLLFFLFFIGALKPVSTLMQNAFNPVLSRIFSFSSQIKAKFDEQTNRVDYISENKKLQENINKLIKENSELKIVEQENKILREQLGFLKKNQYKYVTANIISKGEGLDFPGQAETIDIDKGALDGIVAGFPVISGDGIIIGKIFEAKEHVSKIYLTNSNKCKLGATILNQAKTTGITEGDLGLTINMNFIPQNVELKNDDIVVTSGLEKSIPRGLIIGKISKINKEVNELWQTAVIEPTMNYDDLYIVTVLTQ